MRIPSLALAVRRAGRPWSAPYRERAQIAHSTYGLGEPLVGPAADPGRAGQAGVHSLGSHGRQIHAPGTRPGTIVELAKLSQTACRGYLGLRPLLRLDPVVPNSLCLFRDPSRKPRGGAYPGDPASHGVAQQIVECCCWDRPPPRFLIRDRDSRYGALFDRRLEGLGITQIRTPFRAPQANSIAERWVRSVRQECLDHTFIFSERHLRRVLAEYITYFNLWRPHRSIGQRAPCAPVPGKLGRQSAKVVAEPVLGGLHHVYQLAA